MSIAASEQLFSGIGAIFNDARDGHCYIRSLAIDTRFLA